jgi:hypothetical protein
MSEPKRQHIIPKCYLKQFVDPHTPTGQEPYVWIFDRGSKKGEKRAPRNILTETDLYTFSGKDGTKNYSLENSLAQIESDYASLFEQKNRSTPATRRARAPRAVCLRGRHASEDPQAKGEHRGIF